MKYTFWLLLLLGGLLTACDESSSSPAQLEDEVMAIHDEVMPKMGDINAEIQRLNAELEELRNRENVDPSRVEAIKEAVSNLKEADQSMRMWMRNYAKDYVKQKDHMTEAEKVTYLQAERTRVQKVKDSMLGSLEQARSL